MTFKFQHLFASRTTIICLLPTNSTVLFTKLFNKDIAKWIIWRNYSTSSIDISFFIYVFTCLFLVIDCEFIYDNHCLNFLQCLEVTLIIANLQIGRLIMKIHICYNKTYNSNILWRFNINLWELCWISTRFITTYLQCRSYRYCYN